MNKRLKLLIKIALVLAVMVAVYLAFIGILILGNHHLTMETDEKIYRKIIYLHISSIKDKNISEEIRRRIQTILVEEEVNKIYDVIVEETKYDKIYIFLIKNSEANDSYPGSGLIFIIYDRKKEEFRKYTIKEISDRGK